MQRRPFLLAAALTPLSLPVRAHHGWSSFDQGRPVYLSGTAAEVRWRNPHAELVLEVAPGLSVPGGLAQRPLPAQSSPVDGPGLLSRAVVPTRRDARWTVELAPLTRMQAWQVPELKVGDALSLVGFTFAQEQGEPIVRVEYLFLGERTFGLRSSPA